MSGENAVDVDFVADYLIAKGCKPDGEPLTQLGLQKLVYLCQGWHLALTDEPLFREDIRALQLGPVVPELLDRFKICGRDPLPSDLLSNPDGVLSAAAKRLIDNVWSQYAKLHSSQLVDLTHEEGSPWDRVWNGGEGKGAKRRVIPNAMIRDWFKQELAGNLAPRPTRPRNLAEAFERASGLH